MSETYELCPVANCWGYYLNMKRHLQQAAHQGSIELREAHAQLLDERYPKELSKLQRNIILERPAPEPEILECGHSRVIVAWDTGEEYCVTCGVRTE